MARRSGIGGQVPGVAAGSSVVAAGAVVAVVVDVDVVLVDVVVDDATASGRVGS